MNSLTKVLLEDLLEADGKKVTAIYGGGFKPPTKGHFDVVKTATEQNPEIDEFIIYVGSGVRDGIAQAESIMIWEIYKKYLPLKVKVEAVKTPVGDILRYAKDHPDEEVLWIIGARENNPEDFADIASRTRTMEKYPNLQLRIIQTSGGVSGTATRKAVRDNNKEQFYHLIPDIEEKNQVWDIVSPIVTEGIIGNAKEKLKKFISAIKQENRETKAAFSLLIKSAKGEIDLTEEQKKEIGAQLKDVLKLVGLTAIATLPGGFIAAALIKLFKAEHLITPSSMMTEDDPKKGTGKKPEGSGRRLYTDEDPKDTVRIKFKTKEDIVDTLNKTSFKSKSHARQSQVINLIHQRVRAAYGKAKDPEVKARLKRALDYIELRKESSKKKTERLRKMKEASDPQAGTALPYGSGFAPVKELVTATDIICDNCGWKWAKKDGGNDLYICHKCGHDNAPKQLTENSIPSIDIKEKLKQLDKYMIEKGYNIEPLPSVEIINDDKENAENFLGRTAFYDPNEKKIVLYTYGRHPKDICRSYTHEMVHHIQNLENRLGNVTTTNTLEDDHVANLEKEANLKGTMTFRNFTDSLKENKDPFGLNAYARELALGLKEILNENPSEVQTKKININFELWTGRKISENIILAMSPDSQGVFELGDNIEKYTGLSLKDAKKYNESPDDAYIYGLVNTMNDGQDIFFWTNGTRLSGNAKKYGAWPAVIEQLAHEGLHLARAILAKSIMGDKFPTGEWPSMGEQDNDTIEEEELTTSVSFVIEQIAPSFIEMAKAYIPELKNQSISENLLDEGRYDSIVTQLARYTIKGWKDDQEHGEPTGRVEFEVGPGKDLEYGDLEFLYKGIAIFADVDLYSHNGYARANSGEVGITFSIPPSELPKMWERVYNDVTNTLRHEIEHLTQSGKNVKPNKAMASDSDARKQLRTADNDTDYFLLPKEIDANLQGLYLKAKKTRQPFEKVVNNYLKYDLNLSLDDQEKVKNAWRPRIKALSLPKI